MHDKRAHICGLRCKCKLSAELGQRFVEAEQAGGYEHGTYRKQQFARLNPLCDQCTKWRRQQSADKQPAGHDGECFQSDGQNEG